MNITQAFIIALIAVIAAFDAGVVYVWGQEQSISRHLYNISVAYPIVPFAVGVVVGHVFWPVK